MKLEIDSSKIVPLFENYSQFVEEGMIKITKDGMASVGSDRAMVTVIGFDIKKSEFEKFGFDKDRELCISISEYLTVFKRIGKGIINMDIQDGQVEIKSGNRTFVLPILSTRPEESPDTKALDFKSSFEVKSKDFNTAIKDGLAIDSDGALEVETDGKVSFKVSSSTGQESETEFEAEKVKGKAKSIYPLDYLSKLTLNGNNVKFEFGDNYPCRISWENVWCVIAPRVSDDS